MTMQVKTLLKLSVAAAVATIVMKTLAWWITDSVGLLSDAMESFVNLASALFAIAMVTDRRSARPTTTIRSATPRPSTSPAASRGC